MRDVVTGSYVRWLHISDFHVKADEAYDRDRVLGAFVKGLPSLVSRTGPIDFIIASGDIANSGKSEEYIQATRFFDDLLNVLKLDRHKLFVVPGNHDCDRSRNAALSRTLLKPQDIDSYFNLKDEIPHVNLRQSGFINWYNQYFEGIREFDQRSTVLGVHVVDVRGKKIQLFLINSATFSADDSDHGKLILGRRCLEAAFASNELADRDAAIAVFHHPVSWLSMSESSNIKALLMDSCEIVLTGHLHENDVEQVQSLSGELLHLSAGASYQTSSWPNTALICTLQSNSVEVLPIQYVDRPKDTWTVDPSVFPNEPTFSRTFFLSRGNASTINPNAEIPISVSNHVESEQTARSRLEWQDDLLTSPTGKPIYVEPRVMPVPQNIAMSSGEECVALDIEEIASGQESYLIECRSEHGGSNLAKRIAYEIDKAGGHSVVRNARTMPTYKAKIVQELSQAGKAGSKCDIIFDNFDIERDQRLLRELQQSGLARKVILISVHRDVTALTTNDVDHLSFELKRAYLWPLSREALRAAASLVFDTDDTIFVTRIVDKVYHDLLALCIPLTPPSAIMYLRVLAKENDFTPLNRVHIINRYISENLSKSSDIYRHNFNSKNKIDIISSFTYSLFQRKVSSFSSQDWFSFCSQHKNDTLKQFEEEEFFNEIRSCGIIIKVGLTYYFRYSFFYNFFLGRHLASNRGLIAPFLSDGLYLEVPGVIDVITGLEADNTAILKHLTEKVVSRQVEFANTYVKADFDPLLKAIWPDENEEEEKLWKPVYAAIEEGPKSVEKIDQIKTSLLSEARTADQQVTLKKFTNLENTLFMATSMLSDAFRNSDDVPAQVKLSALEAILKSELIAFQVGTMFADKLASNQFFAWGSILFQDFNKACVDDQPSSFETIISVIVALSDAVATKVAEEIGTYKLANVFRKRAEDIGEEVGYFDVLLFSCILEAKGPDWQITLREMILKTSKNAYYLRLMLGILMRSFSIGLEKGKDLEHSKRLVALIHSKRGYNKMNPGEKLVSKTLKRLLQGNIFDVKND